MAQDLRMGLWEKSPEEVALGDPEIPKNGLQAALGAARVCTFLRQDDQQGTDTQGLTKLNRSDCFAH